MTAQQIAAVDLPEAPTVQLSSSAEQNSEQDAALASDKAPNSDKPVNTIHPQQQRMFGFIPNFAAVSGGTTPPPPGWKTDFKTANRQAFDYTSFGYLTLTSAIAYAMDEHPSLNTYNGGNAPFWGYLWRGFVDKTSGTYQGSFLFPALLHEDTRYFAMGRGTKTKRTLHALSSLIIARNYSGQNIPNIAGLMGKVGTQALSTTYYPPGSEGFGDLAVKFAYSCMRQEAFSILREFSPDIVVQLHRIGKPRHKHLKPVVQTE